MLRCLLVSSCHTVGLLAQGNAAPTEDQRAVFELLDEFDPLDTSKLPFVVVVLTRDGQRWERYGFLESSDARQFSVRYIDLGRDTLQVRKERGQLYGVCFEPSDLRLAAARAIKDAGARAEDPHNLHYYTAPDRPMPPDVEMLFLARACARSGRQSEVDALWEALPKEYRTRESLTGGRAHELASALDHRLPLDFTDPRLSWTDLLARHEKWLALFPNHFFKESVSKRRDGVASYLEAKRRRMSEPHTGKPSPADLVFDLHDEFHGDMQNLYFDAFEVSSPEPRPPHGLRPTDRLIELDLEAVPALIDALADESPTRTVVYSSRFGGHFSVESIAALAECTLIEISGWQPPSRGDAAPWRAWYERARKDGIRKLLEDGVAALEPKAVTTFLRRWPKELDTVLAAMRTQGPDQASPVLSHLLLQTSDPDERLLALCVDFAGKCKEWGQQLFLAQMLLDRSNTSGVAPVLANWQSHVAREKKAAPSYRDDPEKYSEWERQSMAGDQMLAFLVQSGDLAAWRAITEACTKAEVRLSLATQLLQVTWPIARKRVKEAELAEIEACFRKCLLQLLADDSRPFFGVSLHHGGREVALHEPSCADIAACVLAANWPVEFAFDAARTRTARNRQILALRGKPAAAPPAVAAPASETAEQALARANRVTRVTIDACAAVLDAQSQDRIRALQGKTLTAEAVLELAIATSAAAKNQGVRFSLERTGEGDGTSVTVAFASLVGERVTTVSSGHGGPGGWDARLLVTAGGVQLGTEGLGVTSGTLERVEQLEENGKYVVAIKKALSSEPNTGVEITVALQNHLR